MILRDNTKIEIEKFLQICEYLDCDPEEFYNEFREQSKKICHQVLHKNIMR